MSISSFETPRVSVRHWAGDLENPTKRSGLEDALLGILTPPVLEHLPPPMQLSETDPDIAAWVSDRAGESDVLLIKDRTSRDLLGLMILAPDPHGAAKPTIHIGYLLAETAWGQGFASELVKGLVAAFANNGPVDLVGGVGKGNIASARVLEKAGFSIDKALSSPDTDTFVRQID